MRRHPAPHPRHALLAACLLLGCVKPTALPSVREPAALVPAGAVLYGRVDLRGLAENPLLGDETLVALRERALGRLGLGSADARKVSGPVQVFALSTQAVAAFLPGLRLESPRAVGAHRGVALYARAAAGEVGASVAGGALVGHEAAVRAGLDALLGVTPLASGSPLEELVERGAEFPTLRLATLAPGPLLGALTREGPPPALLDQLRGWATYLTLQGARLSLRMVANTADERATLQLAEWLRAALARLRARVARWRESAGLLGAPLTPALQALDAIRVEASGTQASLQLDHDLEPLVRGGLLSMLRTMQLL